MQLLNLVGLALCINAILGPDVGSKTATEMWLVLSSCPVATEGGGGGIELSAMMEVFCFCPENRDSPSTHVCQKWECVSCGLQESGF